jgi:hypothetical protein
MGQRPRLLSPYESVRHFFGAELRTWRERRGLSQAALGGLALHSGAEIGKVEKAERWPSADLAARCDDVLDTGGVLARLVPLVAAERTAGGRDHTRPGHTHADNCGLELAVSGSAGIIEPGDEINDPAPGWLADQEDNVRRRSALALLATAPLALSADLDGVDPDAVRLDRKAEIYRHLYHGIGEPRDLLDLTRDHLDRTSDLLRRLRGDALKRKVLRNRSEVATLAGRLAFFDLGDSTQARGYFGAAYEAATQATDDALAAAAMGHLAFVPARDGNVAAAADYLRGAGHHASRTGVPALRSWIYAVESEVCAPAAADASLRAVDRAESLLHNGTDDAPPPVWFDYYSSGRLNGFRGHALLRTGRAAEARQALIAALGGLPSTVVKQRAVVQLDIATTYVTDRAVDVDDACRIAHQAIDSLTLAGYATATDRLHTFCALLRPWRENRAVREFEDRLEGLAA